MSVATRSISAPLSVPQKRLFTVREFERMAEAGILNGRYELVEGEVIEMAAAPNAHSVAVEDLRDVFRPHWPHPKFTQLRFGF